MAIRYTASHVSLNTGDKMEQEMIWVTFVGGPLDGQSRRLERDRKTYDAPYARSANDFEMEWKIAVYKIERHWRNNPNTMGFREWFTGVLV